MKIELRNVKYAAFASEETSCFEAVIYIDGKRAGRASNQGQGGPTDIEPRELSDRLDAYGATLPEVDLGEGLGDRRMMKQDGEWLVDSLLTEWLIAKDLKGALGKRVVFVRDKEIQQTKVIPKERLALFLANPEKLAANFKVETGAILNLMPFDQALAIYRAAAE